ncbi:MAG: S41 family peptidase [Pegethrix bostrychoides GSE-TBD4-15B]|jgi:carboxyl-terminal processing protease|uniref:S41 family peptidase n=1 Tax=Pegethrix bostrychoides GSE-TBD4-15B TaxID=2839662 RepID=A0A951PET8_9CYAN|nr:S41 family peptidase [Pegethrix bostrychoides GSE-TBD4-15B]
MTQPTAPSDRHKNSHRKSCKKIFPLTHLSKSHKWLSLGIALSLISLPIFAATSRAALQDSPKAMLDEAWQVVNQDYVDPSFNNVDWSQVRQDLLSRSYSSPDEAYAALRDKLEQLNDPYTRFMNPEEYQAFNSQIGGELVGVGMLLKLDEQTKALTVVKPIEGSPAMQAGVQAGDKILKIGDQSTVDMPIDAAVSQIRGEVGTTVEIQLQRQDLPPYEVSLTRQAIQLPTVKSAVRAAGQKQVGYIRLEEFNAHAADQMRQAIVSMKQQKVDAFVLDLRGNPGGRLDQAIEIARMWIKDGAIVRTVDRVGKADEPMANNTALTNQPMAVLVDGGSASASEILTGALMDDGRAISVGSQTFGKALVQESRPLSDGSGINVTIAHYFTPSGLDINHRGITPDIVINLTQAEQQNLASQPDNIGTASDPQYQRAVTALNLSRFSTTR